MFKIILTAMDSNARVKPYTEELNNGELFKTKEDAEIYMFLAMNDELSDLNQPDENNTPHTGVFIADLNGEHDAIIRLWDGDDYWDVSYYDIVEVSDLKPESSEEHFDLRDLVADEVEHRNLNNEVINKAVQYIKNDDRLLQMLDSIAEEAINSCI